MHARQPLLRPAAPLKMRLCKYVSLPKFSEIQNFCMRKLPQPAKMLEPSYTNSHSPEDRDPQSRLAASLIEACHRAHELGRPVLVRIHVLLHQSHDPWTTVAPYLAHDVPSFFWNDGDDSLCAAAVGALDLRTLAASTRFTEARECCAHLFDQVLDVSWDAELQEEDVCAAMPSAFMAFTFDGKKASRPRAMGDSSVLVPALIVHKVKEMSNCAAVLQLSVESNTDIHDEVDACARLIDSLRTDVHDPDQLFGMEVAAEEQSACKAGGGRTDMIAWVHRVNQARKAVWSGSLTEAVLARTLRFTAPPVTAFDPLHTLFTLRQQHPASTCFGQTRGDGVWFLGASPETLVRVSGSNIATHAVAGTARRGTTKMEDAQLAAALLQSSKERHEHIIVANAMKTALEPLCAALQCSPSPNVLRLPRVQHLETKIAGQLREDAHVLDLVERLHPTPAVCGWPITTAQTWLAQHESFSRGYYAGPIGWVSASGDGVFAVAIRSALMTDTFVQAFAGAGIVSDSDPVAEWRETELKLQTIGDALQLKVLPAIIEDAEVAIKLKPLVVQVCEAGTTGTSGDRSYRL